MKFHQIFAISLMIPAMAFAGEEGRKDYGKMYQDCLDSAGQTNNGSVQACAEGVSTSAKNEINALYKQIYERILGESKEDAAKFVQAQKFWVSYRNWHCEIAGSYVGSPMYAFCPMTINVQRVSELRELNGD